MENAIAAGTCRPAVGRLLAYDGDPAPLGYRKILVLVQGLSFEDQGIACATEGEAFFSQRPDKEAFTNLLTHLAASQVVRDHYKIYLYWYPTTGHLVQYGNSLADSLRARGFLNRPRRLTIIAHSLGGLVARWAVTGDPQAQAATERLITLATPNLGLPVDWGHIDIRATLTSPSVRNCYNARWRASAAPNQNGDSVSPIYLPWSAARAIDYGLTLGSDAVADAWEGSTFLQALNTRPLGIITPLGGTTTVDDVGSHNRAANSLLLQVRCLYQGGAPVSHDDFVPITSALPAPTYDPPLMVNFRGYDHLNMSGQDTPGTELFATIDDLLQRGLPKFISRRAGNKQIGDKGQPLPGLLRVQVLNRYGSGVYGVPVTFSVVSGGGNFGGLPEVTTRTNDQGFASVQWTLGFVSGTQEIKATLVENGASVGFTAQAGGVLQAGGTVTMATYQDDFAPGPQSAGVTASRGTLAGLVLDINYHSGADWLWTDLPSSTTPAQIWVAPLTTSLAPAEYSATVVVSESTNGTSASFEVKYVVWPSPYPIVATLPAEDITSSGLTMVGSAFSNMGSIRWYFEYAMGSSTCSPFVTSSWREMSFPVSITVRDWGAVTGGSPGMVVSYRLVVSQFGVEKKGSCVTATLLP